jgi:hypothetical protein
MRTTVRDRFVQAVTRDEVDATHFAAHGTDLKAALVRSGELAGTGP